ncbi:FecR family protein [Chryseobacterium lathyri]|uniref:Uncharacterized protein n=1 Tax=Chryseobacterium lathyri TaxID=395933 RepID=A0A511YEX8_9FLAO|nr:FecR domain-containing protein [Chryseobacterium lathyri]GEN73754.1 hypothetical protein CLA01_38260 [Chryseobacterium lathyri]
MEEKPPRLQPLTPQEDRLLLEKVEIWHRRQQRIKIISASAIIIILSIGSTIGYNAVIKPDVYFAQSGLENVLLSDGSRVTLSKGAKLTVEKSFPSNTREVLLEGDAVFNVAKSKVHPFIVHGKGYETKVLGTIFKVSQSGKTFKVDLFEGKVLVYKTGRPKDPVPLAPKQTFTNYGISGATSVSETEDKSATVSKDKSASLTFNECPINDAVQVIEKTYGIKVQYSTELKNTKITITVPNATADAFIQTLGIQLNLNTRQSNDSTFELEK